MPNSPIDRILARQHWLDNVGAAIQAGTGGVFKLLGPVGPKAKNLLHGTRPLGHPLHPAITDVPVGAWLLAVVLDLAYLSGHVQSQAADIAIVVGLAGAVLAALTGYTDFHEVIGHERRAALVHGLSMTATFVLYVVSFGLRTWAGPSLRTTAIVVSLVGFALVVAGSYLGGHLVFGLGTAVNRNAFAHGTSEAVAVGSVDEFIVGTPRLVDAGGNPVLVTRMGQMWGAIGAVCSHAGGPLQEGAFCEGVIECPWHNSKFDVRTGAVEGGPATFAQPRFAVTVTGGVVSVQAVDPGQ